eukprot:scaffold275958_cov26-Tisochrysis_lutea.AAC.1
MKANDLWNLGTKSREMTGETLGGTRYTVGGLTTNYRHGITCHIALITSFGLRSMFGARLSI